jgi:sugar phosphate isomerase/epimerase
MTLAPPHGPIATFLPSLPLDFAEAVRQAAELGFTHVDVVALTERPEAHLEALADAGVMVSCAALGRGLPEGHSLDAADVAVRRATLDALRHQVADAARLGATRAYLVPVVRKDASSLAYFAEGCVLLADYAAGRMVRLCVEHVPGRALATADQTLVWLEDIGHANLGLLLDVGHCLISGEDAADVARRAGSRLAYLHLDDNDGVGDFHWPLLTGRLTHRHLQDLAAALRDSGYRDGMALELNPVNAAPGDMLRAGRQLVERLFPSIPLRHPQ